MGNGGQAQTEKSKQDKYKLQEEELIKRMQNANAQNERGQDERKLG